MSLHPAPSFSPADRLLIGLACALTFVWSLPDLIALRIGLALLLLGTAAWRAITTRSSAQTTATASPGQHRSATILYGILTLWVLLQAGVWGLNPAGDFKEIWGQWIRSGLVGLAGVLLATTVLRSPRPQAGARLACALLATLAALVALHDGDTVWRWLQLGYFPFQQIRIVENRTVLSYVANLVLAFLCAETVARLLHRRAYLPIPSAGLATLFALSLFCTYALGTRNGTLGILGLLASSTFVVWFAKRKAVSVGLQAGTLAVVLAGIAAFGWATFKSDPRWQAFQATVVVAWDTEHQAAWKDPELPYPPLPDGTPAEGSAYLRLAWGKEAIQAIAAYPLGVGFGRSAFGQAMRQVYPDYRSTEHSHSGILDFTLGVGLPGLALWLAFLGTLGVHGWRAFFVRENPAGLLLLFLVTGYFSRSLVDSNIRDHMLEQFMFLAGVLTVLAREDLHRSDAHDAG
ncbi:O-antigen ligase family protein [Oryzomicrobium sp.]|uniref:O-antigen ligase family protein n=1 Tax=Oryzomicrobium sp. TaxID=1911578 RepID=UPI0025F173F3|nr:O-antigen ligase family protein [Oryzomicrobium sp.]MCE1242926.1 O-antigen ligase family protein [Oryzomicrobium sp.]